MLMLMLMRWELMTFTSRWINDLPIKDRFRSATKEGGGGGRRN